MEKNTALMKDGSSIRNKTFKIVNFSSFLLCAKFLYILSKFLKSEIFVLNVSQIYTFSLQMLYDELAQVVM